MKYNQDNKFFLIFIIIICFKKFYTEVVKTSGKVPADGGRGQVNNSEFRKKSSITGFEKIVVNKK